MYLIPHRTRSIMFSLFAFSALAATDVAAEDYYRWVNENGTVNYGSRPPEGVKAEKITTFGKSSGKKQNASTPAADQNNAKAQQQVDEQQKAIIAQRKKQCEEEKSRLDALKAPGRRISMEQEDGTTRYLTPEEIAKEVSTTEDFIKQACQ